VVAEKVMGVFDTTGFEEPGVVEGVLAKELEQRGLRVLDLEESERSATRAKVRQLLQGDELAAREVALLREADFLLTGSATSKPAGPRLLGTNMQSIQASVAVRLIRADGEVVASATGRAAEVHIDEIQGGFLALSKATEKVVEELDPALRRVALPSRREGTNLTLQVKGLVSYRHLDYLLGYLQDELAGSIAAQLRGYHGGVAEVGLVVQGDANGVARAVGNARFTGFRLEVTHVTPTLLEMEVVLDE